MNSLHEFDLDLQNIKIYKENTANVSGNNTLGKCAGTYVHCLTDTCNWGTLDYCAYERPTDLKNI